MPGKSALFYVLGSVVDTTAEKKSSIGLLVHSELVLLLLKIRVRSTPPDQLETKQVLQFDSIWLIMSEAND